jgi:hypothetical protein
VAVGEGDADEVVAESVLESVLVWEVTSVRVQDVDEDVVVKRGVVDGVVRRMEEDEVDDVEDEEVVKRVLDGAAALVDEGVESDGEDEVVR